VDDDESFGPVRQLHALSLIEDGKPSADTRRQLLHVFCQQVRAGPTAFTQLTWETLGWVTAAMEKYLSSEEKDIAKSLGLTVKGRRPDSAIQQRDELIAARVVELLAERGFSQLTDSANCGGVFGDVAEEFNVSDSVVRAVWYAPGMQILGHWVLWKRQNLTSTSKPPQTRDRSFPDPDSSN